MKKEIIGALISSFITVVESKNESLLGVKGEVIDETKNTIKLKTKNKIITLIKNTVKIKNEN